MFPSDRFSEYICGILKVRFLLGMHGIKVINVGTDEVVLSVYQRFRGWKFTVPVSKILRKYGRKGKRTDSVSIELNMTYMQCVLLKSRKYTIIKEQRSKWKVSNTLCEPT